MTQALLNYVERKGLSVLNWVKKPYSGLERVRCGIEWLDDEEWSQPDDTGNLLNELREVVRTLPLALPQKLCRNYRF